MTIKTINIGTNPNDNTGEGLRDGLEKVNDNFTDSANAASKLMATDQQALDGTAGVVPDAEQVHEAFGQFGLGATDRSEVQFITTDAAANSLILPLGSFYAFSNASTVDMPSPYGYIIIEGVPNGSLFGWVQQRFIAYDTGRQYVRTGSTISETFGDWDEILTSSNTTVDGNGFIKQASPIINLFDDQLTGNAADGVTLTKAGTGVYTLDCVEPLAESGWYIETPRDRNGNIYFTVDYEQDTDARTLTIRTYTPDYSAGAATNGAPVDIKPGRFVALRFNEPPAPELPEPVETEE